MHTSTGAIAGIVGAQGDDRDEVAVIMSRGVAALRRIAASDVAAEIG